MNIQLNLFSKPMVLHTSTQWSRSFHKAARCPQGTFQSANQPLWFRKDVETRLKLKLVVSKTNTVFINTLKHIIHVMYIYYIRTFLCMIGGWNCVEFTILQIRYNSQVFLKQGASSFTFQNALLWPKNNRKIHEIDVPSSMSPVSLQHGFSTDCNRRILEPGILDLGHRSSIFSRTRDPWAFGRWKLVENTVVWASFFWTTCFATCNWQAKIGKFVPQIRWLQREL